MKKVVYYTSNENHINEKKIVFRTMNLVVNMFFIDIR